MVPSKSHIDTYAGLASNLIGCDPQGIVAPKDLRKDLEVLASRVKAEGISFLTKTLPKLGKALDAGLVSGRLNVPREIKIAHGTTSRPAFMQAYFSRVFGEDGIILDEACPMCIKHIRQVCFLCYKLELPYAKKLEDAVVQQFKANEEALVSLELQATPVIEGAAYLVRDVLKDYDVREIVPRHGPGSVSTGEKLDDKWHFSRLVESIHQVFPYYDYIGVGRSRESIDWYKWYKSLRRVQHGEAKVVLVSKDSRGPRLISCEGLENQFFQQGIMRTLVPHIEASRLTRGRVNFSDQTVNRNLALNGSKTGEISTIDLKDASDLVSMQLVRLLFKHNPDFLRALEAVRAAATRLPSGEVLPLQKHAPMGSALCFPIMALSCWAVIVSAVARATRLRPELVGQSVFVYGDDIIVPTEWARISMQALTDVGLVVNEGKSCTSGFFRESCGMDAYKGVDVTPVRLRTVWTARSTDGEAYASYVSYANNLLANGYVAAYEFLLERLSSVYGGIPYGTETAPYPALLVADVRQALMRNRRMFRSRFNAELQRWEVLLKKVESRKVLSTLDGWQRLLRDLVAPPGDDPDVLVVRRSNKIKRRWMPVF